MLPHLNVALAMVQEPGVCVQPVPGRESLLMEQMRVPTVGLIWYSR